MARCLAHMLFCGAGGLGKTPISGAAPRRRPFRAFVTGITTIGRPPRVTDRAEPSNHAPLGNYRTVISLSVTRQLAAVIGELRAFPEPSGVESVDSECPLRQVSESSEESIMEERYCNHDPTTLESFGPGVLCECGVILREGVEYWPPDCPGAARSFELRLTVETVRKTVGYVGEDAPSSEHLAAAITEVGGTAAYRSTLDLIYAAWDSFCADVFNRATELAEGAGSGEGDH